MPVLTAVGGYAAANLRKNISVKIVRLFLTWGGGANICSKIIFDYFLLCKLIDNEERKLEFGLNTFHGKGEITLLVILPFSKFLKLNCAPNCLLDLFNPIKED